MVRLALLLLACSALLVACSGAGGPLPHSLYFRDGPPESYQVYRLERDGVTRKQLTHEPAGVDDFSVSPRDGKLAIISDNRLYLLDPDGSNPRLLADGHSVSPQVEDYAFRSEVSSPSFSPDGRTLAYGFDGLHLYDLATGQDQHVLTNLGNLLGEVSVFAREVYVPGAWSPDGRRLLIIMGYYEGSTLAVMQPGAAQPFTRLRSEGPACCHFTWTADSRWVLADDPDFAVELPGLWRFDAATGQGTQLLTSGPQGSNYVGFPVQLADGDLLFFHGHKFIPDTGIPLVLERSRNDATGIAQVRPEQFYIGEALWASDGSLALVSGGTTWDVDQLLLVRPDDSPLQVLIESARYIRELTWGP